MLVTIVICALLIKNSITISTHKSELQIKYRLPSLFKHFDLVLVAEKTDTVEKYALKDSQFQQSILNLSQFAQLSEKLYASRLHYGPTFIYLKLSNISQLYQIVRIIGPLYKQRPKELYMDSRLRTIIELPSTSNLNANKTTHLLHRLAKKFPLNSEVFVTSENSTDALEIYHIEKVTFVKPIIVVACGLLKRNCGTQIRPISCRRSNFLGALVKAISFAHQFDRISVTFTHNNGTLAFSGGNGVRILWDLQYILNFSIMPLEANNYLVEVNGELVGMGAQLQNGIADVAIPLSYFLDYRLKHLTALLPLSNEKIQAYFRQPRASSVRNIYTSAFSRNTWLSFGIVLMLLMLTSFFLSWMGNPMHRDPHWWSEENALSILSMICQKDWYLCPTSLSGKILMLVTLFLSLVCFSAYSGAIISSLAFEDVPVTSPRGLIDYGYNFIFDPTVYYSFFNSGPTSSTSNWQSKVLKTNGHKYIGDKDALTRMMDSKMVFLTTNDIYRTVYRSMNISDAHMRQTVSKVDFSRRTLQSGFFVAKGSPFKEIFNAKLLVLMEVGLINHYWRRAHRADHASECCMTKTNYRSRLGIEDVLTPFLILSIGIVLSLVALTIEKNIYAFQMRQFRIFLSHYFMYA